jgi:hypothetical protein
MRGLRIILNTASKELVVSGPYAELVLMLSENDENLVARVLKKPFVSYPIAEWELGALFLNGEYWTLPSPDPNEIIAFGYPVPELVEIMTTQPEEAEDAMLRLMGFLGLGFDLHRN